jgi:hypothetical protein
MAARLTGVAVNIAGMALRSKEAALRLAATAVNFTIMAATLMETALAIAVMAADFPYTAVKPGLPFFIPIDKTSCIL